MNVGRLAWLGAGLAPAIAIAGCQPATWIFDETAPDATAPGTLIDGATDAVATSTADAMVARDAWVPPDGCAGDPACLSCTPGAGDVNPTCPTGSWFCNPEVLRCVECFPPHFSCPVPSQVCIYGRCLEPCNSGTCGGVGQCNADDVCVPCLRDQDCMGIGFGGGSRCTVTGQCVECTSNDDCSNKPSVPFCSLAGLVVGQCVGCRSDNDCKMGSSCNRYGTCESPGPVTGGPNDDP